MGWDQNFARILKWRANNLSPCRKRGHCHPNKQCWRTNFVNTNDWIQTYLPGWEISLTLNHLHPQSSRKFQFWRESYYKSSNEKCMLASLPPPEFPWTILRREKGSVGVVEVSSFFHLSSFSPPISFSSQNLSSKEFKIFKPTPFHLEISRKPAMRTM